MYTEAFSYPLNGEDATKHVLIGSAIVFSYGLLAVFASLLSVILVGFLLYPLMLVPVVLLYGYAMEIFDSTLDGATETPPFDDWGEIATQGVRAFGLLFVYQIPMGVALVGYILVVVGVSATVSGGAMDPTAQQAVGGVSIVGILLLGLLSVATAYVVPAALCSAAHARSITAGFDLGHIREACLSSEYAIAWVIAIVVYLTLGTFSMMLSLLLVGIPLLFYTTVVMARLVAVGYREALGIDPDASTPAEPDAGATGEDRPTGGDVA